MSFTHITFNQYYRSFMRIIIRYPSALLLGALISLLVSTVSAQQIPNQFGMYGKSQFSDSMVIVNWYDPEGITRLANSKYREDFNQLAHFFAPQVWVSFCGIASATMVLNAMRVPQKTAPANPKLAFKLPKVWGGKIKNFHFYTQETFFTSRAEKVKSHDLVALKNRTPDNENDPKAFSPGVTLAELKELLIAHDAKVDLYYASKLSPEGVTEFRQHLIKYLAERDHFIIANFHGRSLGMNSGGHISPLGAYDQKTDSILVLDVASSKRPWIWVDVDDFYFGMHQKDGENYRGYLVVSD